MNQKAYKFRLLPNKTEQVLLAKIFLELDFKLKKQISFEYE